MILTPKTPKESTNAKRKTSPFWPLSESEMNLENRSLMPSESVMVQVSLLEWSQETTSSPQRPLLRMLALFKMEKIVSLWKDLISSS